MPAACHPEARFCWCHQVSVGNTDAQSRRLQPGSSRGLPSQQRAAAASAAFSVSQPWSCGSALSSREQGRLCLSCPDLHRASGLCAITLEGLSVLNMGEMKAQGLLAAAGRVSLVASGRQHCTRAEAAQPPRQELREAAAGAERSLREGAWPPRSRPPAPQALLPLPTCCHWPLGPVRQLHRAPWPHTPCPTSPQARRTPGLQPHSQL